MNPWLTAFAHSPLAREPWLLGRKLAKRLGLKPALAPATPPATVTVRYPPEWNRAVRTWLDACSLKEPAPSGDCVFGRRFAREELLEFSRNGPKKADDLSGDIKLPWEFLRCHDLPLRAYLRGAAAIPELVAAASERLSLQSGPAWSCAMEVAIRAVNLVCTDALLDGALAQGVGSRALSGALWQHVEFIGRHLEALRITSNHYLSNLLGLLILGRALPKDPVASRWLAFARREWPRALLAQTHSDGGLREASLRYHAFVTEMALLARLFDDFPWPVEAMNRLRAMVQVVADHEDAAGDVFPVGDDDSGRVLAVEAASSSGRATLLLKLAAQLLGSHTHAAPTACYPESGWWTARAGDFHAHLEFGGVGLWGVGAHAHDDDLALCLSWRDIPLLIDPGSYLYTPDRAARDRFRSASVHSTVRVYRNPEEPAPLKTQNVFIWNGRLPPLPCRSTQDGMTVELGSIQRTARLAANGLSVTDQIKPQTGSKAHWFFHLHPALTLSAHAAGLRLESGGERFILKTDQPIHLTQAEYAPRYGSRVRSTVASFALATDNRLVVNWRIARET